jgi:hypothetical protein
MRFKLALLAAAALMFSGCLVTSLDPLYTEKDIVADPGIVGNWMSTSDSDSMVILQQDAKSYRVIYVEDKKAPGVYELRLIQLGKHRFYDLFPAAPTGGSDVLQGHYFPVHSFGMLERNADSLRFRSLNQDWLKQQLQAHPNLLPHRTSGDALLLTAPTPELQKFVHARAEEPGFFADWESFQRRR